MEDIFRKLRDQAKTHEADLKKEKEAKKAREGASIEDDVMRQVAESMGKSFDEVAYCCGNICPHCQTFLDKAVGLVELGHAHHLFMNPNQEECFLDALRVFREDRKEYEIRKQELMDRMR